MTIGELGIVEKSCRVVERNAAGQTTREVLIERTYEDGRERQTTVRECGYKTLTSETFAYRAMDTIEAREFIAHAEAKGLLS